MASGGITIGAAIEHQKLKDEQEMKNALVSFEEELLQQMNLLWYQIGKLKKVVQKLVPRVSNLSHYIEKKSLITITYTVGLSVSLLLVGEHFFPHCNQLTIRVQQTGGREMNQ